MATRYTPLSGEALEVLRNTAQSVYLDGECYAFAIALKRGLGWPLAGLMEGDTIRHAMAYGISHKLYDVRGGFAQDDPKLGQPFSLRPPYQLRQIKEEQLRQVRPVHERTIRHARKLAEIIWPNWPWRSASSAHARMTAFLDDLESISRRHGVWVRAAIPNPAMWPHLSEHEGDESGYTLYPTEDGQGYIFDRRLGFKQ